MTYSPEDSPPLLTISIPTYNRADLLGEALDAILMQVNESNASLVEVVISDNASPDKTADVVRTKSQTYAQAQVTYNCQPANIGAERNVLDVMAKGTGTYLLLLSDDDVLLPGGLDAILTRLRDHPGLNALALNMCGFAASLADMEPPQYILNSDRIIYARGDALAFLGTAITFISCLVVRRELIHGKDFSDSIGTFFPHSHAFLFALAHDGGMLITKDSVLATRGNTSLGYNFYEAFVTGFAKVMKYAESIGYPSEVTRAVLSKHSQWLAGWTTALVTRQSLGGKHFSRLDAFRRLYAVYGADRYVLVRIIPVLLLPRSVAVVLSKAYRSVRRCCARSVPEEQPATKEREA